LAGTFGMVASTHWLASSAGMAVLERGGNAFDAAAAAAFTLHICEPHMNGPGGEVPVIFVTASDPTPRVLCGQGVSPASAGLRRFRELGLDLVPGTGLLAATVPGAVGAWLTLLRDHGTMRLRDVLDFAIGYAQRGHPVVPAVVETIAAMADLFRTYWPTSAQLWLPAPAEGNLIRNPALAATYRRLVEEAEAAGASRERQLDAALRAWYEGFVAEAIDEFCRTEIMDDSGRPNAGLLTGADLAAWRPTYEPTVSLDVFGWQVHKVGPWSQGPALLQQLAMLEALGTPPGPLTAAEVHRVVEVAKLAFADRDANYGDGADLSALLDPAYAADRAKLVGTEAGPVLRNGRGQLPKYVLEGGTAPAGLGIGEPTLGGTHSNTNSGDTAGLRHTEAVGATKPAGTAGAAEEDTTAGRAGSAGTSGGVLLPHAEPPACRRGEAWPGAGGGHRRGEPLVGGWGTPRGDTCHIDVADRWGNVVSATPSGGWLQSSPAVPSLGFCLGTRAQMFWLEDGLPNTLAPGKRPRSTLSPSFAVRQDGMQLSFGTPGGDQQDQWQLVFFLNHAVHGMNLQAAIDSPVWHTTAFASSFYPRETGSRLVIEARAGDVIDQLRRLGHDVEVADAWSLGRMSAISRDVETGILRAAANARGQQGYAVGR
jgi:gamma-glutamyltranspeptidase/glutathione hydrolase